MKKIVSKHLCYYLSQWCYEELCRLPNPPSALTLLQLAEIVVDTSTNTLVKCRMPLDLLIDQMYGVEDKV